MRSPRNQLGDICLHLTFSVIWNKPDKFWRKREFILNVTFFLSSPSSMLKLPLDCRTVLPRGLISHYSPAVFNVEPSIFWECVGIGELGVYFSSQCLVQSPEMNVRIDLDDFKPWSGLIACTKSFPLCHGRGHKWNSNPASYSLKGQGTKRTTYCEVKKGLT